MNEQELIERLSNLSERYAKCIDDALTKTGLETRGEPQEIAMSAQLTGLLMTAARRTVRAKMPDIALFTALQEALKSAKLEMAAIEKEIAKRKAAPQKK